MLLAAWAAGRAPARPPPAGPAHSRLQGPCSELAAAGEAEAAYSVCFLGAPEHLAWGPLGSKSEPSCVLTNRTKPHSKVILRISFCPPLSCHANLLGVVLKNPLSHPKIEL